MKKKLALLLALTMVLSVLPMNLFGAAVVNYSDPGSKWYRKSLKYLANGTAIAEMKLDLYVQGYNNPTLGFLNTSTGVNLSQYSYGRTPKQLGFLNDEYDDLFVAGTVKAVLAVPLTITNGHKWANPRVFTEDGFTAGVVGDDLNAAITSSGSIVVTDQLPDKDKDGRPVYFVETKPVGFNSPQQIKKFYQLIPGDDGYVATDYPIPPATAPTGREKYYDDAGNLWYPDPLNADFLIGKTKKGAADGVAVQENDPNTPNTKRDVKYRIFNNAPPLVNPLPTNPWQDPMDLNSPYGHGVASNRFIDELPVLDADGDTTTLLMPIEVIDATGEKRHSGADNDNNLPGNSKFGKAVGAYIPIPAIYSYFVPLTATTGVMVYWSEDATVFDNYDPGTKKGYVGTGKIVPAGTGVGSQYRFADPSVPTVNPTDPESEPDLATPIEDLKSNTVVANRGLKITVPDADKNLFSTFLYINELRIAETVRGDLSQDRRSIPVITFRAPENYSWIGDGDISGRPGTGKYTYDTNANYKNPDGTGRFVNVDTAITSLDTTGRAKYIRGGASNRYLSLILPLSTDDLNTQLKETVSLYGLGLVADDRAPMGDVKLDYTIQWIGISATNTTAAPYNFGYSASNNVLRKQTADGNSVAFTNAEDYANVAKPAGSATSTAAVGNSLTLPNSGVVSTDDDNFPTWTKGMLVGVRSDNELEFGLSPDSKEVPTLTSGKFRQETATVRLTEKAAQAWGAAGGMDLVFTVSEGAIIQSAKVKVSGSKSFEINNAWFNVGANGRNANGYKTVSIINRSGGALREGSQGSTTMPSTQGVTITPNALTLKPTVAIWDDVFTPRYVEVTFELSIEPGFASKYDPAEILIYVDGSSAANLYGPNYFKVADVVDMVEVSVDPVPVTVTDQSMYFVAVQDIGRIFVSEKEYGFFERGSEIWVYVTGARAAEVEFTCDTEVFPEGGTTLKLSKGIPIESLYKRNINGIRFTVQEESRKGNFDAPMGSFEITNGKITGPVYPGLEYEIVISGSAVAENNVYVFENAGGNSSTDSWNLFYSSPYSNAAFSYDEETSAPPPAEEPAAEVPPVDEGDTAAAPSYPATIGGGSVSFNEYTVDIDDGKPFRAFMFRTVPNMTPPTVAGYLASRTAANAMGLVPEWDDVNKIATFTGIHKLTGETIVVTVKNDSPIATINGEDFDIAEYSGNGCPTGSIFSFVDVESGRNYLPMRFLANAYGRTIAWDNETRTATLHN